MTYLSQELYEQVTATLPIACVDAIPVRRADGSWQIGVIIRATGSEHDKAALIGGRVHHNQTISEAISMHLSEDLGVKNFKFFDGSDEAHPFYVQQYRHGDSSEAPRGYDPTKHAITPTYLVYLDDDVTITPRKEAREFKWLSEVDIPEESAFNQHFVMREAFRALAARPEGVDIPS